MAEEAEIINLEDVRSEVNSEIGSDFEFDDEMKQDLNSLLNIPLEFVEESSEEEDIQQNVRSTELPRGDSVERQLEALFVDDSKESKADRKDFLSNKDSGLENISDNEFDGPESGECDTSDGELPDSPSIVVTLSDTPPVHPSMVQGIEDVSLDEESEIEQKIKPNREVVIEDKSKCKEKKEKVSNRVKEKSVDKSKNKNKKGKSKRKGVSGINEEDIKKKLKLKKYLVRLDQHRAKCLEVMNQISKKCDVKKDEKNKVRSEINKVRSVTGDDVKLKSVVEKVIKEKESSPQSSTSSRLDQMSHSSHSSRMERVSFCSSLEETTKVRSIHSEKEHKLKPVKYSKSVSKELKEKHLKYKKYLQLEREKCYQERMELLDNHIKAKKRHKKSESKSSIKTKENTLYFEKKDRPRVLSFAEFCDSRELASPEKEINKKHDIHITDKSEGENEKVMLTDSLATTTTKRDHIDHADDDKELFITYSEIVEQDKMEENKKLEEDREKIENILEKDPELKSISVFTSVLFKGSADSSAIPFLQGGRSPSPKAESFKPKPLFTQSIGPDEIYDWNDDLSNISQSSLSPSRSPAPKVHNKALLNYLENQKHRLEKSTVKTSSRKSSKSYRSRSKSPKKERLKSKKRKPKHCSSISISPSPPPLKARSPDYKKRSSPPAYLKERWRDHHSPIDRRREHYERPSRSRRRSRSRTRRSHRSRSSSEERRYRRYRSRSRSKSHSPSPLSMVQISGAEKRRKLKEEHERALACLRATIRKPLSTEPLSITFKSEGDGFEAVRDNYDPVVMNEVRLPPNLACYWGYL